MTFKELTAATMIVGQVIIVVWLLQGGPSLPGVNETLAGTAMRLVWAVAAMVVWNIVAAIIGAILLAIMTRSKNVDEPDDERDRHVGMRAMRNAYFATAIAGLGGLLLFAFGFAPVVGVYAVFGALMLGGFVDAASRLAYYRLG